jgi:hypothetical protein
MRDTLGDLLDCGEELSEIEWFSILFQLCFGLAVANKHYNFVHNDLHGCNIMFQETKLRHLYFQVDKHIFKIPTFGRITKIIDFARATFTYKGKWIISDVFHPENEASGQYDYPNDGVYADHETIPNPSFDLVRLATTIYSSLDSVPKVAEFIDEISRDDYNDSVCELEDDFDLYIHIAMHCHNADPAVLLDHNVFKRFIIPKNKVMKGTYIYKFN